MPNRISCFKLLEEWKIEEKWVRAKYIDKNKKTTEFDGWYEVSNFGRLRSYREYGGGSKANARAKQPRLLTPTRCQKTGYYRVTLRINGKAKLYLFHRLVLSSFIEIPNQLMNEKYVDVNHIDEDKKNNYLNNLSWCTRKENNLHGTRLKRSIDKGRETRSTETWRKRNCGGSIHNSRPVVGVHTQTHRVIYFESMSKVNEFLSIPNADRSVSATIRGKQKTAYGYKWFYEEEYNINN